MQMSTIAQNNPFLDLLSKVDHCCRGKQELTDAGDIQFVQAEVVSAVCWMLLSELKTAAMFLTDNAHLLNKTFLEIFLDECMFECKKHYPTIPTEILNLEEKLKGLP